MFDRGTISREAREEHRLASIDRICGRYVAEVDLEGAAVFAWS